MRIRKKCPQCNRLYLMEHFNENLEYPDKKMRVCKLCEEQVEETKQENKIEEVMATINLDNTPHKFEKQNLVSNKDGSDTLICKHCKLKVKRFTLGSSVVVVGKADELKIKNCITKPSDFKYLIGQTVEVTSCSASGEEFKNLTPGSSHQVVDAPIGQSLTWRGVWVMGVSEEVMLLNEEYKLIIKTEDKMKAKVVKEIPAVEVPAVEVKETLKEKRERVKAEKLAAAVVSPEVPVTIVVEELVEAPRGIEIVVEVPAVKLPKKSPKSQPKEEKVVIDTIIPTAETEAVEVVKVELNADGTVPEGYKQCKDCGGIFLLTDYHKDSSAKDGVIPRCKACYSITQLPENVAKRRAELAAKKAAKLAAKK